jgi:hypothetical protein
MNLIQSKIEQTAKELLTYQAIADKDKEFVKKQKGIIAEKALDLDEDTLYGMYFDTLGSFEFLVKDMLSTKAKLYNQLELVKDAIDIPKEITDLVSDYSPAYTFAIIGDEKKLVDENAYKKIREDYIQGSKDFLKLTNPSN